MKLRLPADKLTLVFTFVVLFWVFTNLRLGSAGRWRHTIHYDAKGYYAYLPAVFIYHDLDYEFLEYAEGALQGHANHFDYRTEVDTGYVNKYYAGTAVLQTPFFLVAHGYALLSGSYKADGYSEPYMYGICIAAIFYALLGLWFINKILELYNVGLFSRVLAMLITMFGTNLFNYVVAEPGMSHVYSFAAVGGFVYYLLLWIKTNQTAHLLWAAVAFGLILLIRPINVMVLLFIPFLCGSFSGLKQVFFKWIKSPVAVGVTVIVPLAIFSIQLLLYKIQVGSFFVYSYSEEGFNFANPHIIDILFSYKKGLFVYTPALFVGLLGLYWFFKDDVFKGLSFLLAFLTVTFILSSWWQWWYGGSFSGRSYIEYFPFLIIPLGVLLNNVGKWPRVGLIAAFVFLVYVCQVQIWQYRNAIMHWDSMTSEMYWDIFLKTK
jgi:hypothetical protein